MSFIVVFPRLLLSYYKVGQFVVIAIDTLLQSGSVWIVITKRNAHQYKGDQFVVITKWDDFITKWDRYYKVGRFYYKVG